MSGQWDRGAGGKGPTYWLVVRERPTPKGKKRRYPGERAPILMPGIQALWRFYSIKFVDKLH